MITPEPNSPFAADEPASARHRIAQASYYEALGTSLWEELAEGRAVALASSYTATHCVLEVARCPSASPRSARKRAQIECLRRILAGKAPKELASESKCSASTLAGATGYALDVMGFGRRILYVPYLLVRAAHVAAGSELPACRVTPAGVAQTFYVSVERPDLQLAGTLSPAEQEVTSLMLQGHSNTGIAHLRGNVSVRTIANQISSIFVKLGTSGRGELLCALVEHEQTGWPKKPRGMHAAAQVAYLPSKRVPQPDPATAREHTLLPS